MSTKRIGFFACTHCGHRVGLTPPPWQLQPVEDESRREKFLKIQRETWDWFSRSIRRHRPFDIAVWNGDMIDGTGHRSGGTELICTDRNEQLAMAEKIVSFVGARKNVFLHGTPYHTGEQEDMEDLLASRFGEEGHTHEHLHVNGVVFDVKHHVGSSSVPHGRLTALSREEVWNALWAESHYAPRADWIIRAHVHYSVWGGRMIGPREINFLTLPALQAMGSKYGARQCVGLVDYGYAIFDVSSEGETSWQKEILFVQSQKVRVLKL